MNSCCQSMILYESGRLKLIGQFSRDVIGCKTRVKFINSNWSVSLRLLLVKLRRQKKCFRTSTFIIHVNNTICNKQISCNIDLSLCCQWEKPTEGARVLNVKKKLNCNLDVVNSSGSYGVILDERHYRELLMQHVTPPVAKVCSNYIMMHLLLLILNVDWIVILIL